MSSFINQVLLPAIEEIINAEVKRKENENLRKFNKKRSALDY